MRIWIFLLMLSIAPLTSARSLTIGILSYNPPFEVAADTQNKFYGFDADIIGNVCKRMDVQCKFKSLDFESIFTEIMAGTIDLGIGAIIIIPMREEDFLFSKPYLASKVQFVTSQTSKITSLDNIKNLNLGCITDPVFGALIYEKYGMRTPFKIYKNIPDILNALETKQLDLMLLDEAEANFWFINNTDQYTLVGKPVSIGKGYGIVAAKNNTSLINEVNAALMAMESDGSYLKIYNLYFETTNI